jgi:hypothetical protein
MGITIAAHDPSVRFADTSPRVSVGRETHAGVDT